MADPTPAPATAESTQKLRLPREESKCSKEGCKRPYKAKGYCNVHYKAWRRGEMEGHRARYRICTKEGCRKPRATMGNLCDEHLQAARAEAAA